MILVLGAVGGAGFVWWRWEFRERRYDKLIVEVSREYGVDPCLVKAVMRRESRFDPWVYGGHGEIGLMQVTEGAGAVWARAVGRRVAVNERGGSAYLVRVGSDEVGFGKSLLWDERVNVEAGTWYLGRALGRWRGVGFTRAEVRVAVAVAEYNAGYGNVVRWVGLAEGRKLGGSGTVAGNAAGGSVAGGGISGQDGKGSMGSKLDEGRSGTGMVMGAGGGGGELTVEEFVGGITWPGVRDYVEEVMENWRICRERGEM